jgi:glycosyltransferase involved in cell wall biosynthesis
VTEPTVSVITTVFNGQRFLADSVESVLAQRGVDLELVIVDDGSTDRTGDILDRLHDDRLTVLRRPRRGRAPALNEAIAHSRGTHLAVLDADDRCLPDRLARPVEHLDRHPEVDVVGSAQWVFIDEHGTVLGRRPSPATTDAEIRRLLRSHRAPFAHSSVTMRRTAVEAVGGYDEALLVDLDLDLYIRLAARGRLATVPPALVGTRRHGSQFYGGRHGPTRSLRRRVATRRTIDRRAEAVLGGSTTSTAAATVRELRAWAYWRGRRLAGRRPILPPALRQRLDRRWTDAADRA